MLFENAQTWTKQGDIGEARAIYEYTRLGYNVARTLFDSCKYDLVVEIDGELKKVQVKTTKTTTPYGIYTVDLRTTGGNQKEYIAKKRETEDYDILFVVTEEGDCWSIPVEVISNSHVNLGKKFDKYKLVVR